MATVKQRDFQEKWEFVETQGISKLLGFLRNPPTDDDLDETEKKVRVFTNKEYAQYFKVSGLTSDSVRFDDRASAGLLAAALF